MTFNGFIQNILSGSVYEEDRTIMDLSAQEKPLLPCSAERSDPFEIPTLQKLCLSTLHKKLHLETKGENNYIWKNFTLGNWIYRKLPIPKSLQDELKTLLTGCIRHKGGHYMTTRAQDRGMMKIYIKKTSPLYFRLKRDQVFSEKELSMYHLRYYLWYKIRSTYSREEIVNSILTEIKQSIGFRRNWE